MFQYPNRGSIGCCLMVVLPLAVYVPGFSTLIAGQWVVACRSVRRPGSAPRSFSTLIAGQLVVAAIPVHEGHRLVACFSTLIAGQLVVASAGAPSVPVRIMFQYPNRGSIGCCTDGARHLRRSHRRFQYPNRGSIGCCSPAPSAVQEANEGFQYPNRGSIGCCAGRSSLTARCSGRCFSTLIAGQLVAAVGFAA